MPEGDTIFKTAAALRPLLEGRPVLAARARPPGPAIQRVVGSVVTGVEPLGKHLVIHFSNGLALHTHLRLGGTWHRYAPGERWRRPAAQARVVLEVPEHVIVCFNAPVAELLQERALDHHPGLQQLGPDLLGPAFDAAEALRRLRARADWEIAEALLDQRTLAGIGNVYKSEILFIEGIHPWTHVGALDDATLARLIRTAEGLLRANVAQPGATRVTTGVPGVPSASRPDSAGAASSSARSTGPPGAAFRSAAARGSHVWVYGRAGRPCLRCRAPIQVRRQGTHNRTTYWCPTCQPSHPSQRR